MLRVQRISAGALSHNAAHTIDDQKFVCHLLRNDTKKIEETKKKAGEQYHMNPGLSGGLFNVPLKRIT
jgi:hypothetical protein